MTKTRAISITAILLIAAAGCSKDPTSPAAGGAGLSEASLELGLAGPRNGDQACGGLPTAPDSERVDLVTPTFSNPTRVTNPLFPVSDLHRAILLGQSDGEPLRVETTLLPGTRTISVNGRRIKTLVSQYVAWLDRRIHEVAYDLYVQADDGAVWYLGEDVFNYEGGRVADTEGTWLAGREGPAAMIMPANPQVGDVWRPENACGIVFEEVTATATGVTVQGPRGPVSGSLVVRELHMDGTIEDKTFAPGYGEFSTGSGANLEAIALAVPTDAAYGPLPAELKIISEGATLIFRAARTKRWDVAEGAFESMSDTWSAFRSTGVPPLLEAEMNAALTSLEEALEAQEAAESRQASIDASLAALDLGLRYVPRADIDLALIRVWRRQLAVDAAAKDREAVRSDNVTIRKIRERLPERCRNTEEGIDRDDLDEERHVVAADEGEYLK